VKDETSMDCPNCKGSLFVVNDWVSIHEKESLWHCYDCDEMYLVHYKLDKIDRLVKQDLDIKEFMKRANVEGSS